MTLVERGLVLITILLATAAGVGWLTNAPRRAQSPRSSVDRVSDIGVLPAESIDAAARVVAQTDPFRLDRRPAPVRYRPDLEGVVPTPKAVEPALVLEGVVGNAALLDGAPGHGETAIVHVGDTLGGLRVRRISRDTVLISGADTTWRLTLRQAWQ
jgi:hypothetical protein